MKQGRTLAYWAFILGVALCVASAGCGRSGNPPGASPVTLRVANQTGSPGASVVVPITVSNAADVAGVDLALTYDSSMLTATGAATTTLTSGFSIAHNVTSGRIAISMAKATGIGSGSGSGALVNITFTVNSAAAVGRTCNLTIAAHSLFNQNAQAISHDVANGVFTVR